MDEFQQDPMFPPPMQIPQAQGNPSMANLLQMIQSREAERPTLQQQQQSLQQYMNAVRNSQPLDEDPFRSAGRGFLGAPAGADMEGRFAAAGQEIVRRNQMVDQDKRARELSAQQLQYTDMIKRRDEIDKTVGPMLRGVVGSARSGTSRPIKLADGTWGVWDATTQTVTPLAASTAAAMQKDYDTYYKMGERILDTENPDDLHAYAEAQMQKKRGVGEANPTMARQGAGPALTPMPTGAPPMGGLAQATSTPDDQFKSKIAQLNQDAIRYKGNPEILKAIQKQMDSTVMAMANARRSAGMAEPRIDIAPGQAPVFDQGQPPQAAPATPMKGVQREAEKKGYGAGIGKHMADTAIDLQKTGAAAQSLIGDLNTLESLYKTHGDKIPEGALAPFVSSVKSGLKTFGVDVAGQGPTDVVNALATKQALKSRTADGENLLPGAMSNYEDRLLQSMSPGLLMTQEGRMMAIQVAKAQMDMRVKLSEAARNYVAKNRRLDEGWFNVAAEIGKTNPFLDESRIRALEKYAASLTGGKK